MDKTALFIAKKIQAKFVVQDYQFLQTHFNVIPYEYGDKQGAVKNIFYQLRLLGWLLVRIWQADFIFLWFADYHSLLPTFFAKLTGKKAFIVLGGFDVITVPEIKYGACLHPIRARFVKYSLRMATVSLPVSDHILLEAQNRVPEGCYRRIYNGVDITYFSKSEADKIDQILTVGQIRSPERIAVKGIDMFAQVAKKLPDVSFRIIGLSKKLKNCIENPINLHISGEIPYKELANTYQQTKVYCQFSLTESFCLTIAEAMLSECIPVVSNRGAMPEIVGECGMVVHSDDPEMISSAVQSALDAPPDLGKQCKQRVLEHFTLEHRTENLTNLFTDYNLIEREAK